jgi:hypothetical protein
MLVTLIRLVLLLSLLLLLMVMIMALVLLLCSAVKEMLLGSKINILMLCVPLGVAAHMAQWGATSVFILVSSSSSRALVLCFCLGYVVQQSCDGVAACVTACVAAAATPK